MTTDNFRSVEERTVEASRIAREACENAYREGFEACKVAAANVAEREAMRNCDDRRIMAKIIAASIRALPTPTTKGGT